MRTPFETAHGLDCSFMDPIGSVNWRSFEIEQDCKVAPRKGPPPKPRRKLSRNFFVLKGCLVVPAGGTERANHSPLKSKDPQAVQP